MILRHLLEVVGRGQQLAALRRVDAVVAAVGRRRGGDAHVHLLGAGGAHHLDDLLAGGAADDAVVDQDDALALQHRPVGVVLQLHAEVADLVGRLDEGAADVVVADDAELEGDAALGRIAHGRRHAAVGHRHHHIGLDAALARQFGADALAGLVDRGALDHAVGAGEVDVLEDAEAVGLLAEGLDAVHALVVDDDDLAGVDVADELGADDVERAGLAAEHPGGRLAIGAAEPAEHQRPDARAGRARRSARRRAARPGCRRPGPGAARRSAGPPRWSRG